MAVWSLYGGSVEFRNDWCYQEVGKSWSLSFWYDTEAYQNASQCIAGCWCDYHPIAVAICFGAWLISSARQPKIRMVRLVCRQTPCNIVLISRTSLRYQLRFYKNFDLRRDTSGSETRRKIQRGDCRLNNWIEVAGRCLKRQQLPRIVDRWGFLNEYVAKGSVKPSPEYSNFNVIYVEFTPYSENLRTGKLLIPTFLPKKANVGTVKIQDAYICLSLTAWLLIANISSPELGRK